MGLFMNRMTGVFSHSVLSELSWLPHRMLSHFLSAFLCTHFPSEDEDDDRLDCIVRV